MGAGASISRRANKSKTGSPRELYSHDRRIQPALPEFSSQVVARKPKAGKQPETDAVSTSLTVATQVTEATYFDVKSLSGSAVVSEHRISESTERSRMFKRAEMVPMTSTSTSSAKAGDKLQET